MTDAYARHEQIFPHLIDEQISCIAQYGKRRPAGEGEILFSLGMEQTPFFVVLSGALEISQPDGFGGERRITVHEPGEFTGEIDLLSPRRSLVRGRMLRAGEVLELDREAFRRLLAENADLSEVFMRAFILRRSGLIERQQGDIVIIGSRHSAETLRLRRFLSRNGHPFRYIDIDDAGAAETLERLGVSKACIPIAVCRGTQVLRNPSNETIAEVLGFASADQSELRDVIIVGAGPAGLAAAVYASSEGLNVLVIEEEAFGGQAGSSSKIENYLGFPTGISGQALAARAYTQAQKFGAEIITPRVAGGLGCDRRPYTLRLTDGSETRAHTIVIATGARYRKLDIPGLEALDGNGVYYGATHVEAVLCEGCDVVVVGGGNSAGQAAVFLARQAKHVHMVVRGRLAETMSSYLAHRIEAEPNITLYLDTEIVAFAGETQLEGVTLRNRGTGEEKDLELRHLFVMIGAEPNTGWLNGCLALDAKGFVKTGAELSHEDLSHWPMKRPPYTLETSQPGIFAAGDVRSRSVKRVASAVGEGSVCVQYLHMILAEET